MPKKLYITFGFLFAAYSALFYNVSAVQAATLFMSPASIAVSAGNIVQVNISVDSSGKNINTVSGTIKFPTDVLQVLSIDKSKSDFPLWVEEPTFSNTGGTITFDGGVPNPGFAGSNGRVFTVTFQGKKEGVAAITFGDATVLQNDGLGTNVLTTQKPATVEIAPQGTYTVTTPTPLVTPLVDIPVSANNILPAPVVYSSSHPDQNTWYSATNGSFKWNVPAGVQAVQTLLDTNPSSVPVVTYTNALSQKTITDIADGTSYFHIRFGNDLGWGPVTTRKVLVDSIPPEKFSVNVYSKGVNNILTLNAYDALSGIGSYSIQVGNTAPIRLSLASLKSNQYILPVQEEGKHSLIILAYDKAGNVTESDGLFTSKPIVSPSIELAPGEIKSGSMLLVYGSSKYPRTPIQVFARDSANKLKTYSSKTADDGSYSVPTDQIFSSGTLTVWSQLVFSDTIKSPISEKVTATISDMLLIQTSKSVIYALSYIIPAALLIVALLYALYLGWHQFLGLKKRLKKETSATATRVHKAFVAFKAELQEQLVRLEALRKERSLNEKEEAIFKNLKKSVDEIDLLIERKIKRIR